MRFSILPYLVSVAFCAAASPSLANVTILNSATANMTCAAGVCSPTAADAVLNVQDLAKLLAAGNATVTTTGTGVEANNIDLEAPLQWSAATTLSLKAYRSVQFRGPVKVAGTGAVALTVNEGGSGGEFACIDHGRLQFANLSSALTINGTPYVLVDSVASLASAIAADPSGAFALAENYDAKKDGIYASSPIPTVFTGTLQGLGNTISNLSINDPAKEADVGLFAEIESGSTISNVRLVNESVQGSGWVGGLLGFGRGTIAHTFNTGIVSGGDAAVGGLVGEGGLVVSDSGSAAAVSGWNAGGLIGVADTGSISDSWATGNVSGSSQDVGGLVGLDAITAIKRSWASGQISGGAYAGGLVGEDDDGPIERSYASGAVSCTLYCGGLVGWQGGEYSSPGISQCYATGSVTGGSSNVTTAGGLVGLQAGGKISNSYALGAVTGGQWGVGGLVGADDGSPFSGSISASYAAGAIAGTNPLGGLIGSDETSIRHTYWDRTTSGITNRSQGAGNIANAPGIKGLSDSKLKSGLPKDFNPTIWAENPDINNGLPYLIHNPPK
jgi:hypothetical protein